MHPEVTETWSATTEDIGFKPAEMLSCPGCSRSNPPNRLNCLYCGTEFGPDMVDASKVKLSWEPVESWENGYNVITVPGASSGAGGDDVSVIARNTGILEDVLRSLAGRKTALAVARVRTEAAAEVVTANLSRLGISTKVVRDAELELEKVPIRCRSVIFGEEGLSLADFNSEKLFDLRGDSVRLIVSGTIREYKSEASESRKRRGNTAAEIETQSTAQTPVIDIYDEHANGFRLLATGFDFTCLGDAKEYVAARNMRSLLKRIVERFPGARFDEAYDEDRRFLDSVWELEEKTKSMGERRTGLTKRRVFNVTTRTNLLQFNKYSRLQRHLL